MKYRTIYKRVTSTVLAVSAAFILSACTADQGDQVARGSMQIQDPFEEVNRVSFAFNEVVDETVIHPVVEGYQFVVPRPARNGFRNFLRNLRSPVIFANQALQGDVRGAGDVVLRATINTLVGVGGVFDVAGSEGIRYEPEDFGQTLAVWGVGHGPYLVVPVLGPSSLRDYAGYAIDSFADPLRWYLHNIDEEEWYYAKLGGDYLVLREELIDVMKDLKASSIDYYAAVRSTYYQRRAAMVRDNNAPQIPDLDMDGEY